MRYTTTPIQQADDGSTVSTDLCCHCPRDINANNQQPAIHFFATVHVDTMDFARSHIHQSSVATQSAIRHVPLSVESTAESRTLDDMLLEAANQAAADLLVGPGGNPELVDASLYTDRITPQSEIIQSNDLVVIFESFDNLNFCYAKPGEIFSNRNGHFHHDDFIGKPYGCKIRSRNNRGYGFVYLLKPTPELWARSLKHRTQIVHELDASMIVFYLNLRPNMVVCESGTGSGALSHCILRTIAPKGRLYTYEFNQMRAETARHEFAKNGVDHLVTVYHRDVCGKKEERTGGFDRPQASVDAVTLDLPEPWLAVPHAAYCLKPNGRIASYSPCVEQSQRTIVALKQAGFHSIKTLEFRLREHYVDEVEYEYAPKDKRPRLPGNPHLVGLGAQSAGDDTGAEADNEKSEYETEGDMASLTGMNSQEEMDGEPTEEPIIDAPPQIMALGVPPSSTPSTLIGAVAPPTATAGASNSSTTVKRKKMLVARPFGTMRGHTAFLTFATAGNKKQPNPNEKE